MTRAGLGSLDVVSPTSMGATCLAHPLLMPATEQAGTADTCEFCLVSLTVASGVMIPGMTVCMYSPEISDALLATLKSLGSESRIIWVSNEYLRWAIYICC